MTATTFEVMKPWATPSMYSLLLLRSSTTSKRTGRPSSPPEALICPSAARTACWSAAVNEASDSDRPSDTPMTMGSVGVAAGPSGVQPPVEAPPRKPAAAHTSDARAPQRLTQRVIGRTLMAAPSGGCRGWRAEAR